jgi:hypothetical protein
MDIHRPGPDAKNNTLPPTRRWWLFPLLLLFVLLGVMALRNGRLGTAVENVRNEDGSTSVPSAAVTGQSVSLAVDFGNGAVRRFAALPWRRGMTVLDLLERAAAYRPGLSFRKIGSGEKAFVTHIDKMASNEKEGQYWQFWVNDQHGDRSCGVYELNSGDRVLWKQARQQ